MKSNYKLKLFTAIVVLGVSLGNAVAFKPTLIQTTTPAENSDNWVQVQNKDGIIIYFSEYKLDGNSYLKIKFENTTNNILDFSWSLYNNSRPITSFKNYKVNAASSIEFFDATMPISFSNGEILKNFSINIQ